MKFYKILTVLLSINLGFLFFGCTRKNISFAGSSDAAIFSLKGKGFIDVEGYEKRLPFQALLRSDGYLYLETKQWGTTVLSLAFAKKQATLLMPKEKRALIAETKNPLTIWQDSQLSQKDIFSVLMYAFNTPFPEMTLIEQNQKNAVYEDQKGYLYHVDKKKRWIEKLVMPSYDTVVTYGSFSSVYNFPMEMEICEKETLLKISWKNIEINQEIPEDWFDLPVPSTYFVEHQ